MSTPSESNAQLVECPFSKPPARKTLRSKMLVVFRASCDDAVQPLIVVVNDRVAAQFERQFPQQMNRPLPGKWLLYWRRMTPKTGAKVCPECGHEFQGNGWDGIDAHWKANHNEMMRYEDAWPLIQSGRYIRHTMEIDKQKLLAVMEAMLDVSHIFECELLLYQMMFQTLCQQRGFRPEKIEQLVSAAREKAAPKIAEKLRPAHRDLLGKLPKIIDLLNSSQDEFLQRLKAWKPQGPIN